MNAHNYGRQLKSLPIYRFLCDAQFEGLRSGVIFEWGPLKEEFTFLPRVVYQNVIFAFAQWNIKQNDIADFATEKDQETLLKKVKAWRESFSIPEMVSLVEGDHKLSINLANYEAVMMWLSTVKGRRMFTLEEFVFDDSEPVVTTEDGKVFTNEVILSFHKSTQPAS
ncbi:MAG: lantibiotic dehydratase [Bacteroidia bacterium]